MPTFSDIQNLTNTLKNSLEDLGAYLVEQVQIELKQQGHKATGKLIDSVGYVVAGALGELELEVSYLNYGSFVETGVTASRIPFGGNSSGKKTSLYIQALMDWIVIKRLASASNKVKAFAFAIANKHKKEGMPTRNSYKFSNNGRRTGFQSQVLSQEKKHIETVLSNKVGESMQVFITDLVNATLEKL